MPALYRDRGYLKLIAGLLRDTNQFEAVTTSGPPEDAGQSAEHLRLAGLEVASFAEESLASEASDVSQLRTVSYRLSLYVRDPDPDARDDEIDRLASVAANVLTGVALGGQSIAELSRLGRGQYQAATSVERRLQMQGTFAYVIDGRADRIVT
jgi:hypothetical protein